MDYYSIWPFFACMVLLVGLASLPFFSIVDRAIAGSKRISNIDGLRGFLAFGVFFQHAAIYHEVLSSGVWRDPPQFYFVLGQVGVSLFFMITGYLFWGKLIRENGRPNWLSLYVGRVFRIAPVYLFAIGMMLAIVFCRTDFRIVVSGHDLYIQIFKWLAIGFNGIGPDINGYTDTWELLFGVTWTLSSEWKFYLCLLPLALIASRPRLHLPFLVAALGLCLLFALIRPNPGSAAPSIRAALFLFGMTCASLEQRGLNLQLPDHVKSIFAIALIGIVMTCFSHAYSAIPAALLGLVFYLIVSGASMFGLLLSRPCRRLGDASYSIYLLQGLVTTLFFSLPGLRNYAIVSPLQHWTAMAICASLLFLISTMTFVWIERGGIELGKQVSHSVSVRFRYAVVKHSVR